MIDQNIMLIYTYYSSPWNLRSGDDVRIHIVSKTAKKYARITVYNLSHLVNHYTIIYKDGILYVNIPRNFYSLVAKLLKWREKTELNSLIKITHYIDEFVTVAKLLKELKQCRYIYVFGAMSLFSFFARIFKIDNVIIYDPLANYAQTLYLLSRKNLKELIKYGLYLILHNLQLKSSDYIVYPTKIDLENAKHMFNVRKAVIVPNPIPICYKDDREYMMFRTKRRDFSKPFFVLLAGGKGKANEEAVKLTIDIFNDVPSDKFELIITGPWQDLQKFVKNKSIKLTGIVPTEKLKEILAIADYGLAPIFSHIAGTYLKTLTYIAAGLNIVTSPWGIQGLDRFLLKNRQIFIVKNADDYRKTIFSIISNPRITIYKNSSTITICSDTDVIDHYLCDLLDLVKLNKQSSINVNK